MCLWQFDLLGLLGAYQKGKDTLSMNILVLGITTEVGRVIATQLAAEKHSVHILVRTKAEIEMLPQDVKPLRANLQEGENLGDVFKGFDVVCMANAFTEQETREGMYAIDAAKQAGISHFIYLSTFQSTECEALHFENKARIEAFLKKSGLTYTILQAARFMQEDIEVLKQIYDTRVYPIPLGDIGVNRVDLRDVADMIVRICKGLKKHKNKTYPVVGPQPMTGEEIAESYAYQLGQNIRYVGNDLEEWETSVGHKLVVWKRFAYKEMFRYFQKEGYSASKAQLLSMMKVLGKPPRTFDAFVIEAIALHRFY